MLFFRKEKAKPRKTRVSVSELQEQYQNLLGDSLNEFETEVSRMLRDTEDSKREIVPLLEELRNAELNNDKTPMKERHFMEGNRLSYIKTVNNFASKISEPEDISDETARVYLAEYAENADEFKKASFRPGQITSHFFGDLLKRINAQLARIDKNSKDLLALMKSDSVKLLSETKNRITALQKEIEKNEAHAKALEQAEIDYEELKKERAFFEQRVSSIRKNSSFAQLGELSSLLRRTEEELKITDAGFIDNFLQIEKALKKFSKSDDETLIGKYIDDPVSTVLSDPDLRILGILAKTSEALKSGALEIEEKKKEKLAEKIASLSREKFTKFIISHNDLTLKINEFSRRLKQNNSQRELDDIKYKLEHVQKKQETAGENIKKLNQQIENSRIVEFKESIENAFETMNSPIEVEIYEDKDKKGGV